MNKREVLDITGKFGLSPNKSLGQNFLVSNDIRDKIMNAVNIDKNDSILEIGPGLGALTGIFIEKARFVTSVEIDSGMVRFLKQKYGKYQNFSLVHGDFLKTTIADKFTKIISNLPYYCSSEILFNIAFDYDVENVFVMLQKEMAERIISGAGEKNYGALSVTIGFYFEPKIEFNVSHEAFFPKPGVRSSFISLKRKSNFDLDKDEINLFHRIVKSAFWGRRKTILKALTKSPHIDFNRDKVGTILSRAGITPDTRGEDLSVYDYVNLVKQFRG